MDNDNPDARAAESLIDEWLENDRHTAVTAPVHSEAADQIDQWMIEDDAPAMLLLLLPYQVVHLVASAMLLTLRLPPLERYR